MSQERTPPQPQHWTYRVEAAPVSSSAPPPEPNALNLLHILATLQNQSLDLLRQSLEAQKEHLALTRELVHVSREQRQRQAAELERWQAGHGAHIEAVKDALGKLEQVHANIMGELTETVADQYDNLLEGDFSLTDFVDRFGPRLAHLNTILAVLRPLTIVLNGPQQQKRPES